mmetsp:Transcript_16418/g.29159  ORF Transcript_16418/g.29159 Transcript_16418/m.29159 type:complete len:592 (+) Transcript_16418:31-1806(+)
MSFSEAVAEILASAGPSEGAGVPRGPLVDALLQLRCVQSKQEADQLLMASGALCQPDDSVDLKVLCSWLWPSWANEKLEEEVRGGFEICGPGCCIERAEERAISLHQLTGVVASSIRRFTVQEGWKDRDGRELTPQTVDLYSLVPHFIKPATASRKCSFVELVATSPQPPDWFVSHWWGEPVLDFVKCLWQHSRDRNHEATATYWVCAYANNQWDLGGDVCEDPAETSFRKAMRLARGLLSVLDAGAICYRRIWCIYEIHVANVEQTETESGSPYLFDVYTVGADAGRSGSGGGGAIGITDGYVAADGTGEKQARKKRHREWKFPFELVQKALDIDIQTALASEERDRLSILNSIAGAADLSGCPPAAHENYDRLNSVLHGRFVAASWVRAAELQLEMSRHSVALAASQLRRLALHFGGGCLETLQDAAVTLLAESLPTTLESLFLGFAGCRKLTDAAAVSLAASLPGLTKLRDLELRFATGAKITDLGCCALAEGITPRADTLQQLHLDFTGNPSLTDAACASLAESLLQLKALRQVWLSLGGCKQVSKEARAMLEEASSREGLQSWVTIGKAHCDHKGSVDVSLEQAQP